MGEKDGLTQRREKKNPFTEVNAGLKLALREKKTIGRKVRTKSPSTYFLEYAMTFISLPQCSGDFEFCEELLYVLNLFSLLVNAVCPVLYIRFLISTKLDIKKRESGIRPRWS